MIYTPRCPTCGRKFCQCRRRGFTVVEMMVALTIVAVLAALIWLAVQHARKVASERAEGKQPIELPQTDLSHGGYDPVILTVEHDGHKFIVWQAQVNSGTAGCIIHHPGCDCLKKAEKE